jgi:hypothetical protein
VSAAEPVEVQVTLPVSVPFLPRQFDGGGVPDLVLKNVQHMMNARGLHGLDPLVENGKWGTKTKEAVKWVQRNGSLPETGKVDEATWAELLRWWLRPDLVS